MPKRAHHSYHKDLRRDFGVRELCMQRVRKKSGHRSKQDRRSRLVLAPIKGPQQLE